MSQTSGSSASGSTLFSSASVANTEQFTGADWGLFLSISIIWGASFLLIAEALESLTPGFITLGRTGLGAITLVALRVVRPTQGSIAREDWPRVVLLSVLWVAIPFTLFPLAEQHINSAITGLLNGGMPIFAAIVSTVLVKTAPTAIQRIGILVGFVGVVLISLPSLTEGSSQAKGVLMVLAATVCYGFAINVAAPLQQRYGAVLLMSSVLVLAALWNLPYGLYRFGDNEFEAIPVLSVAAIGVAGTGLAYWIFATLVGRVGPIRASFITYLIPVVSLVLGVVIRDDEVAALAIVGAALTIGGALLASRKAS